MKPPYSGGCMCGAVRYRLDAEPLTLYACHCTDCQRRGGSAFGLSMPVARSAVTLTRGEPVSVEALVENGRMKRAVMCATCGVQVWGISGRNPDVLVIRPGTLDDHSWLVPVAHLWTRSRQPWVDIPKDIPSFEGQPDDVAILPKLWRDRKR